MELKSESNFYMVSEYERDLVSVVVPAYNAQLSLARCIRSILSQTYSPIEIIVVNDDGSLDQTEQKGLQEVHRGSTPLLLGPLPLNSPVRTSR